jgi:adenine deaminase
MVFYKGKMVAREGSSLTPPPETSANELSNTMHIKPFSSESLKLIAGSENFPVIEIVLGQIITRKKIAKVKTQHGAVVPDIEEDVLKLVVVERHKATGNIGLGMVKGFGLKRGALASSIAHDSHNIVSVGTNDSDIFSAIKEVEKMYGGLVVCADGKILAALPLPIAGLLSPEPLKTVVDKFEQTEKAAASLGNPPPAPFAILSFVALPVIPELRLSDMGIVDVLAFKLIR